MESGFCIADLKLNISTECFKLVTEHPIHIYKEPGEKLLEERAN